MNQYKDKYDQLEEAINTLRRIDSDAKQKNQSRCLYYSSMMFVNECVTDLQMIDSWFSGACFSLLTMGYVVLCFTGVNEYRRIQLDSIEIREFGHGADTTADTTLVLNYFSERIQSEALSAREKILGA